MSELMMEILRYLIIGMLISMPILFLFGIYKLIRRNLKSVKKIAIAFTVIYLLICLIFTLVLKTPTDPFYLIPEGMSSFDLFLGLIFPLVLLYFALSIMYLIYRGFIKKGKIEKSIWIFTVILFFLVIYIVYFYYIDPPTFPQWHDYDMVVF